MGGGGGGGYNTGEGWGGGGASEVLPLQKRGAEKVGHAEGGGGGAQKVLTQSLKFWP